MTGVAAVDYSVAPEVLAAYGRLLKVLATYRPPCSGRTSEWYAASPGPDVIEACLHCRARVECGEYAEVAQEHWGIWGGVLRSARPAASRGRTRVPA